MSSQPEITSAQEIVPPPDSQQEEEAPAPAPTKKKPRTKQPGGKASKSSKPQGKKAAQQEEEESAPSKAPRTPMEGITEDPHITPDEDMFEAVTLGAPARGGEEEEEQTAPSPPKKTTKSSPNKKKAKSSPKKKKKKEKQPAEAAKAEDKSQSISARIIKLSKEIAAGLYKKTDKVGSRTSGGILKGGSKRHKKQTVLRTVLLNGLSHDGISRIVLASNKKITKVLKGNAPLANAINYCRLRKIVSVASKTLFEKGQSTLTREHIRGAIEFLDDSRWKPTQREILDALEYSISDEYKNRFQAK
jgi:hypothetical protein